MVFGIFRQVAMCTGFGNRLDDSWSFFLLAPAQLLLQVDESTLCHRHFFDHFIVLHQARGAALWAAPTQKKTVSGA
ncbi:hypothetical protein D9M70_548120 [compost metagenome]